MFGAVRQPAPAAGRAAAFGLPNPQYARGLDLLVNAAHGTFDTAPIGQKGVGVINGSATLSSGALGRSIRAASGGSDGVYWPLPDRPVVSPLFTVMIFVTLTGGDAEGTKGFMQLALTSASSGSPDLLFQRNNTDIRVYHAGAYIITDSGVGTQNTTHCVVVTADGTTVKMFRNGALRGTYATSSNCSNGLKFWVGNGYASSAGCDVFAAAHWTRPLKDADAAQISAKPSVLWRRNPLPIGTASGGGVSTLRPAVCICT